MTWRPIQKRRWRALLAVAVMFVVGLALGLVWFARTEMVFAWAVEVLAAQSGGRLAVEGVGGSILGPLRFAHVHYRNGDLAASAHDVEIEWSPAALWHRAVRIARLHAARLEISVPVAEGDTPLPETLALPWGVAVDRVRIDTLAVRAGNDETLLREIGFRYAGGPARHRLADVALQASGVRIGGVAEVGATRPFAVLGSARAKGEGALDGVDVDAVLGGTLEALDFVLALQARGSALKGEGRLAPFARRWLPRLALDGERLDLAAIDRAYPKTAIALHIDAHSGDAGLIDGRITVKNGLAGSLTDHRLPLVALRSGFSLQRAAFELAALQADLGAGGRASGSAQIAASGSRWRLAVEGLNLRALHRPLRATALKGKIRADVTAAGEVIGASLTERAIAFTLSARRSGDRVEVRELVARAGSGELRGNGAFRLTGAQPFTAAASFRALNPADFGDYPQAALNGRLDATGELRPSWSATARFALADSRFRGAPLAGEGTLALGPGRVREANVALRVGDNRLQASGSLGTQADALQVSLDGARIAQFDPRLAGRLAVQARVSGTLDRPAVEFEARGEALRWLEHYAAESVEARGQVSPELDAPLRLEVTARRVGLPQGTLDSLAANVAGTFALHEGEVRSSAADLDIGARFAGAWNGARTWRGTLTRLKGDGRYPFELAAPVRLEIAPSQLVLGAAQVALLDGRFSLQRLRWEDGRLDSEGEFTRLPAAPLLALAGWPAAPGSDLRLRGDWSISATPRLNGFVRIARESGDLRIDADAPRGLGLQRLAIDAQLAEDVLTARADAAASTFGVGTATVELVPPAGAAAGRISPNAAVRASATTQLDSLRGLDALAGLEFAVDARLSMAMTGTGTLQAPIITGVLDAEALRLDVPRYGIALKDGTAHVKLDPKTLSLEATLAAAAGGRLTVTGTSPRRAGAGATKIEWRAAELRLLNRRERRLVVSGGGLLALVPGKLVVRGEVRADEGYIEFERHGAARLNDDIIIAGRERRRSRAGPLELPLDVDLTLDAGPKFTIIGAGLDAVLRGRMRVQSTPAGVPVAKGTVETARGTYFAFGRDIEIERGRLYFDGPIDDPALDIRALRRNQAVQAGVEVTGTVHVPLVRLVSDPPVSDAEKISWLVLGRSLDSASTADFALLQSAAGALVDYGDSVPVQKRLARGVGLDTLALRGSGTLGSQVVAAGKRLSDKLYLEYEQGLTGASNVVRLNYILTRALTLRAETGTASGIGVTYGLAFD